MAWINVIDEKDAEGRLKESYDRFTAGWGGVDNILKIHSLNPKSLDGHYEFYKILMTSSRDLPKSKREMIAVTVSALNHCVY
jgi:alkylhydroperoxidase family enzyme